VKYVYIDESGTIGPKDKEPYFVIVAIMFDDEQALKRMKHVIKRKKARLKIAGELKAKNLNTAQKQHILNTMAGKIDYRIAYIVIEKSKISPKLYEHKNVTYNFLFGILIKNILAVTAEDIRIVSDSRTTKVTSADSLCEYIRARTYGDWKFQFNIEITQAESHMHNGLQAVDLIANTVFANYNFNAQHLYRVHENHFVLRKRFPYRDFGK
jgi:hypothetical protein